ncbi:MAG: N-acetyltransferase [Candidatus Eisenbacteria bacterium]|nr:N-acetyltransferase [Candidatus Eisenbacteria bacterium]
MADVYVHPRGLNESEDVGAGTRIWAFAHVMPGARVGRDCNIGEGAFVEGGAVLGDCVTVKNGVAVWDLVTCEDNVFLGPYAVLTNDPVPRSHPDYKGQRSKWRPTLLRQGCTVGANATVVCGHTLGRWCFIGAGAVVTRDVADHALMAGNPARRIGWVCRCGHTLPEDLACSCGLRYRRAGEGLEPLSP